MLVKNQTPRFDSGLYPLNAQTHIYNVQTWGHSIKTIHKVVFDSYQLIVPLENDIRVWCLKVKNQAVFLLSEIVRPGFFFYRCPHIKVQVVRLH